VNEDQLLNIRFWEIRFDIACHSSLPNLSPLAVEISLVRNAYSKIPPVWSVGVAPRARVSTAICHHIIFNKMVHTVQEKMKGELVGMQSEFADCWSRSILICAQTQTRGGRFWIAFLVRWTGRICTHAKIHNNLKTQFLITKLSKSTNLPKHVVHRQIPLNTGVK
jgi:hypothetical protein